MRRKGLTSLFIILFVAYGGLIATFVTGSSPELGLDLQGGVSVVLAPTSEVDSERLDESLDIIRTRVDALGVAEPDIARQGDAIVVQLPGVKNRDRALDLVGQTAELRFRPVLQSGTPTQGETALDHRAGRHHRHDRGRRHHHRPGLRPPPPATRARSGWPRARTPA